MSKHWPPGETQSDVFARFCSRFLPTNLSDASCLRFRTLARAVGVARGETAALDETIDQFVFLASGATKLVAKASGGREQVIAFHFQDDLVSVPARQAHAYALRALSDCELLIFPAQEFTDLARSEPATMTEIFRGSMEALWRCREKAVLLGRKTAEERIASFLLSIARRVGSQTEYGCIVHLPMSRRDIADSLGLTIETVSRQFGSLRTSGLVETSGRSVVRLLDIDGLEARAGHLPSFA